MKDTEIGPSGKALSSENALTFSSLLLPSGAGFVVELRALGVPYGSGSRTLAGWYTDPQALARDALKIDGMGARGVYVTPNPLKPEAVARLSGGRMNSFAPAPKREKGDPSVTAGDEDVAGYRWFLIDVDPERPARTNCTREQLEKAYTRILEVRGALSGLGFPEPLTALSGNGFHLMYRVDLAPESPLPRELTHAISEKYTGSGMKLDSAIYNPARIWKLYGTTARKGDDTPEAPHRLSRILSLPDPLRVAQESLFRPAISALKPFKVEEPKQDSQAPKRNEEEGLPGNRYNEEITLEDIGALLVRHGATQTESATLEKWTRPGKDARDGPSATLGTAGDKTLYVFTDSWPPFTAKTGYEPFTVYTLLEHGGDSKAAASALARQYKREGQRTAQEPYRALQNGTYSHTPPPAKPAQKAPEPRPIVAQLERFPVPTFNPSWLPEGIRDYVEDVAYRAELPLDLPATAALVVVGSAIGRRCVLRPKQKDSYGIVPNLWGLIVALPGSKKSHALKEMVKPLQEVEDSFAEENAHRKGVWEVEMIRYQAQAELAKKALKADPYAKDVPIPIKPAEYVPYRLTVDDTTPEALVKVFSGNEDGLLMVKDEASQLLSRLENRQNEEERALYVEMWTGDGRKKVDRVGRGHIDVKGMALAVVGGTQPDKIAAFVSPLFRQSGEDDGLVQRFQLVSFPDPQDIPPTDAYPNRLAKEKAQNLVRSLVTLKPKEIGAEQDTYPDGNPDGLPYLRFTPEAAEVFTNWKEEIRKSLPSYHTVLQGHRSKLPKLLGSLALIVHLGGNGRGPIPLPALETALQITEYYWAHAQRMYGVGGEFGLEEARLLGKKILEGKLENEELLTARAIKRKGWAGLSTPEAVDSALQHLEEMNWISLKEERAGMRTYESIQINPRVFALGEGYLLPDRRQPVTPTLPREAPSEPQETAPVPEPFYAPAPAPAPPSEPQESTNEDEEEDSDFLPLL